MKKTEIYVPIANKKEAEQVKAVLEAMGETVSRECFFMNRYYNNGGLYYNEEYSEWVIAISLGNQRTKITLSQLIEILFLQKREKEFKEQADKLMQEMSEPKKIAVRVNNENEFKVLMTYYEVLGWNSHDGDNPLSIKYGDGYGENIISFNDKFVFPSEGTVRHNPTNKNTIFDPSTYKIIAFSYFTKEHGIIVPLLKWIEEQNKPKEIVLFEGSPTTATVSKENIFLKSNNFLSINIKPKELEEIYKAHKSLQS